MESDLKRIARLEYLKLRQCKQTEKTEAVKVRFWSIEKCEMKQLSRHVNFEDPFEVYHVTRVTHYHQKVRLIILLVLFTLRRKFWVINQSGNSDLLMVLVPVLRLSMIIELQLKIKLLKASRMIDYQKPKL